jgi:hypothetical protein
MDCKTCGQPTHVTHTYPAGPHTRVIERMCTDGHRGVFVTTHLQEADAHGRGAYAVATQIKNGTLRIPHGSEEANQEGPQETDLG